MNSVVVEGKEYVKAKDLARDLGYTTDYVGQLCRAEKVDAQLVGRSWYVSEESLRNHKQSRYRNNKKETVREIKRTLHAKDLDKKDSYKVSVHAEKEAKAGPEDIVQVGYAEQRFYRRAEVPANPASYHEDESELFPVTKSDHKTGRLRVELADAKNVKIASKNHTYDFGLEEKQKLRFKGSLSITDVEEREQIEAEKMIAQEEEAAAALLKEEEKKETEAKKVALAQAKEEEVVKEVPVRKKELPGKHIKVTHKRPGTKRKERDLPLEHNEVGVVGMRRGSIIGRNPMGGTLRVDVPSHPRQGVHLSSFTIVLTIFVAVIVGVLLSGLEQTVIVVNGESVIRYKLDFQNILAAAYDPLR